MVAKSHLIYHLLKLFYPNIICDKTTKNNTNGCEFK